MMHEKTQSHDTPVTAGASPRAPLLHRLTDIAWLNYLLTNRIPRRWLTTRVGQLAKIEQPLVRDVSIAVWRRFSDLDLSEARKSTFTSLHDCFIRELKPGARPIDPRPEVLTSPSDAIVGACGVVSDGDLLQVKGSRYPLAELLRDPSLTTAYRDARYVTLRLTASMYHRFHAPAAGRVVHVSHIAGDTFNVNPPTLARMPRVYCRNERAVLRYELNNGGGQILIVPVAAILVAGLRLHGVELPSDRQHSQPWNHTCDLPFEKGAEMGWFEHGSTILVLAPPTLTLADDIETGATIRMGQPLLRLPAAAMP